jgi:hypothetical protein
LRQNNYTSLNGWAIRITAKSQSSIQMLGGGGIMSKIKYLAGSVVVAIAWVIGMVLFDYDMIDEWAEDGQSDL